MGSHLHSWLAFLGQMESRLWTSGPFSVGLWGIEHSSGRWSRKADCKGHGGRGMLAVRLTRGVHVGLAGIKEKSQCICTQTLSQLISTAQNEGIRLSLKTMILIVR